jgi:hypothetical protein
MTGSLETYITAFYHIVLNNRTKAIEMHYILYVRTLLVTVFPMFVPSLSWQNDHF